MSDERGRRFLRLARTLAETLISTIVLILLLQTSWDARMPWTDEHATDA